MTFCESCAHIRYSGWLCEPRCYVKRMSWVSAEDHKEMLPCVAANDGDCQKYEAAKKPRQGKLKFEDTDAQ